MRTCLAAFAPVAPLGIAGVGAARVCPARFVTIVVPFSPGGPTGTITRMMVERIGAVVKVTLAAIILTAIAVAAASLAHAQQKFPTKPIRIVLGSTPGATPDILARLIGAKMSENWGQPVVIENKVGAGGIIAANVVAKSAPDGYTLLSVSPAFAIRPALFPNLPYDSLKDFAGVAEIGFSTSALVVGATIGVKSVKELIALAQAQPGKVLFSSPGAGTADHMNGERFRLAAGIKVQHVAFKGQAEAQLEVVAGRIHYTVTGLTSAMPFVKDGKLLALAAARRTPLLPGVPSMAEALPGWGRNGSQAILAPARTPLAIRQQISQEAWVGGRFLTLHHSLLWPRCKVKN